MSRRMSFPGKGPGLDSRFPSGSKRLFDIIKTGNSECPGNRENCLGEVTAERQKPGSGIGRRENGSGDQTKIF